MRLHRFLFCLAFAAVFLFAACKNLRSYAATDPVTALEHFQQLTQARLDANDKNAGASERMVFERGAGGKIVGCIFRSHGQKICAAKIK